MGNSIQLKWVKIHWIQRIQHVGLCMNHLNKFLYQNISFGCLKEMSQYVLKRITENNHY